MSRPSWTEYAINLAVAASTRSEDLNYKVGAVVMRPNFSIAGIGYNGAPSQVTLDWTDRDGRRAFVIHAEMNALRYCTPSEVIGGLIAVTHTPCIHCMPMIAAYGIKRVIYKEDWSAVTASDLDEQQKVAAGLGLIVRKLADDR